MLMKYTTILVSEFWLTSIFARNLKGRYYAQSYMYNHDDNHQTLPEFEACTFRL